jgi:hypothetical protein
MSQASKIILAIGYFVLGDCNFEKNGISCLGAPIT